MNNTHFTLPEAASVPTLSSSAMLVHLSIGVWTASKKDKAASAEVADSHGANRNLTRTYKTIIDSPKLDAIKALAATIHSTNRAATLDWAGEMRLLTTANYFKHHAALTAYETEFWRLVDDMLSTDYTWGITQMQLKLGTMFNAADYPSVSELRNKFSFKLSYMMLPKMGDIRLDIAQEAQDQLKLHYEKVVTEAITNAMTGLWTRLYEILRVVSRQLAVERDAEGKEIKGRIFDGSIDTMRELIGLLETCNLTNDPTMQRMQRTLSNAFEGITSKGDLKDAITREETKRAVDKAIAALPSLDF
jgi:hypothetical protein